MYDAVAQMRRITDGGGHFSLAFRTWDTSRRKGGELVRVSRAKLRPQAKDEQIENAHYKLFYVDCDTGEARVCWQPLIVEFNGKQTTI